MVRRSSVLGVAAAIAIAMMVPPGTASAQEPVASPAPPSGSAPLDTVFLRNGGMYRGVVTEIVPGDHVTLAVSGGETKVVPWADVDRIVATTEAPASIPPSPSSPVPPVAPVAPATPPGLDVPPPSPAEAPPRTQWRANRPLLVTGSILFAAGYGPNVVAAAPSTVGLVGRVALLLVTLGLPCWFGGSGYICKGQHGAVQLLIPFAGPFLFASDHPRDTVIHASGTPLSGTAKGLLYASAGLQIAGVATILTGVILGRHERVEPESKESSSKPSFYMAPPDAPGAVGISVGASRW